MQRWRLSLSFRQRTSLSDLTEQTIWEVFEAERPKLASYPR
jgi:hypothetical protein